MSAIQNDWRDRSDKRAFRQRDRGDALHPQGEPPLFRSREDRLHDGMLVGFLALMLMGSAVGLITTLVELLALLD